MHWTRRSLLIGAASAWMAAGLPTAARAEVRVAGGPAFGTYWRATLPPDTDADGATAAIEAVVAAIDAALSPYRDQSEISRFNAMASTDWLPLSGDGAAVAAEGLRIASLTAGAFDPTVGGIVGRYGFGPIHAVGPAAYTDLAVRGNQMRKAAAGVTFDPCGIAKGYALDLMVDGLAGLGIRAFLIELGGEVAARGAHPDGRPWQVGVERPGAAAPSFQRIVHLDGNALATSGDGINGFDFGGRRYSHIIDPRTGEPVEGQLASVSVMAASAMTADGLATALFAMGSDSGPAFATQIGIDALFLARDGSGLRETMTGAFAAHIIA